MSRLLPSTTDPAAEDESVSDMPCAFEPRVAVVVGVLAALLCMTFFLVLYGRHCKRVAARFRSAAPSSSPISQINNLDTDGNHNAAAMVTGSLMIDHHQHQAAALRLPYDSNGGLAQWVIDALPKFQSSSEIILKQQEVRDCPVCLSRYEEGDLLRLLPRCKHAFHVACVDKWLLSRPSCPVCRTFVSCQDIIDLDNYYLHKNDMSTPALPQEQQQPGEEPASMVELEVIVVDSNLDRSSRQDQPVGIDSRSSLSSWDDQMVVLARSRDSAPAFMQQQHSDFPSADNAVAYQHHRVGSDMRRSASLGSLSSYKAEI